MKGMPIAKIFSPQFLLSVTSCGIGLERCKRSVYSRCQLRRVTELGWRPIQIRAYESLMDFKNLQNLHIVE